MKTILAVAVGKSINDRVFETANPSFGNVRPYIKGLISWLANQPDPPKSEDPLPKYNIGEDYKIVYRERALGNLKDAFQDAAALPADLILCMSSSVARAAEEYTKARAPSKPIVAIVSDPFAKDGFSNNVCGVSASRDRLAISCFRKFRSPRVRNIFALHRDGYEPSMKALDWLGNKVSPVAVPDGEAIKPHIDRVHASSLQRKGLLILPADRFFGEADDIVALAKPIPTFWSTPDFPGGGAGGYGFKQELCGQFLAERVARIWDNQSSGAAPTMPDDPRWVAIDPEHISFERPTAVRKKAAKSGKPAKRRKRSKKST